MNPGPDDALASHAGDHEIVRELHAVPPYRVYEVRLDGRRAVLKVDAHPRGHAAAEGRVQGYAAERTSIPVPEVLAVGDDHFLAAWDDDAPQKPETVDADWARTTGALMARLHSETAGDFDVYGPPVAGDDGFHLDGRDAWIDATRDRLAYHRAYLDGIGHADVVDVVDAVDAFLREHPGVFDGAGEPVLCHGNLLPDHVATAGGEATCCIDFEHALVAPGEYDYWRTAIPAFDGADDPRRAAFREGYESVRPLPDGFERRRDAYQLVNGVAYLESLFLQDNVGPEERAARAGRLREFVLGTVDDLSGGDRSGG